jgi:hypothetical protein
MRHLVAASVVLMALAGLSSGAKTRSWHHGKASDQEKAALKGLIVSSEGAITLSRRLSPLAKLDASHVWALAEDAAGNLYAATGDEGKVYVLGPAGRASVVATSEAGQVLSLAAAGDVVYAGTGPSGEVLKIKGGSTEVLCKLPALYVWGLAADPKTGGLIAATGPEGKLFRVTAEGRSSLLLDTKQDHVLCVAVGPDGTVFAGTDRTGRVYRIPPDGKPSVLFQAPQSEVRALMLEGGVLYAGTSATKRKGAGARGGSPLHAKLSETPPAGEKARPRVDATPASSSGGKSASAASKEAAKGSPASGPSAPSAGENSVWRIAMDGGAREVFRDRVLVLALARDGKSVLAGTGVQGQLFSANESTGEKAEMARLDHGQVLCLLRRKDGSLAVGTGDPGTVYTLQPGFTARGTVTSEVLDARLVSRWGKVTWRADLPVKTALTVAVRTGNVSEPDDTWSDWSSEMAEPGPATAPAGRFLQYRVTLRTDDPKVTPALKSLTVRYTSANQPPEVTRVEVPDLDAEGASSSKKVKFKWSATDANEDDLRYRLLVRKEGWPDWAEVEDSLDRTDYEWDASGMPSGVYRLKVIATDAADNPEGEALTSERISAPFVVCHEAPRVEVKAVGLAEGRMSIEAKAVSPLVRLASASFAVNGKRWENVFPTDGLFDSRSESFRFRTAALKPGTYVLVLKVTDAAGNTGSADVLFVVK